MMVFRILTFSLMIGFLQVATALAQPPNSQGLRQMEQGLQRVLGSRGDNWRNIASQVLAEDRKDTLLQQIELIRQETAGFEVGDIGLQPGKGTFVFDTPKGPLEVNFKFSEASFRVTSISTASSHVETVHDISWENLESELDKVADEGFEGAVLVTRQGKIVLQKAYGYSNREKKLLNLPDTVFAIGSAPIDFTHASIRLLFDQGKVSLDDKITKYIANVPADKAKITIRHLMEGESGLPDFHDLPSDKEPDHTWIDRTEAIKRIMNQELLFEPGTDQRHSHSAWGLLAAIVEIASGETYQNFTRKNLYEPAGIKNTGFFGDAIPEEKVAVGYGYRKSSEPNSPPHWGRTSWLVMGSGGQVSTLEDLFKWSIAVRSGKILSDESTRAFIGHGNRVSSDGDMYGFEFLHSHNPECMFMLISNAISNRKKRADFDQLGKRLYALTNQELNRPSSFTLGLIFAFDQAHGKTTIREVIHGGACDKAGVEAGDQLLSANGIAFGHPTEVLREFLRSDDEIRLVIRRGEKKLALMVKPQPRKQ